MRAFLLSLLLLLPLPAAAQDTEITGVIQSQLDAFTDRDVATAWTFAGPNIQAMFGTPDNFGTMVREGYPMVWDNADARFMQQESQDNRAIQRVLIRDPSGTTHVLDYMMSRTSEGWKISGVRIVPAPDTGV